MVVVRLVDSPGLQDSVPGLADRFMKEGRGKDRGKCFAHLCPP